MSYPISIRLEDEDERTLEVLCEKSGLSKSDVVRKLLKMAVQHHLLEPNWRELLIKDLLSVYGEKEKIRLQGEQFLHDLRESSKERDRQLTYRMHTERMVWNSMDSDEQRMYIEAKLHGVRALMGEEPQALPEQSGQGFNVYINGKRIFVKELLPDGTPKVDYNQDRLVKCETGFHTKGTWCSSCPKIGVCHLVRQERLDLIAKREGSGV